MPSRASQRSDKNTVWWIKRGFAAVVITVWVMSGTSLVRGIFGSDLTAFIISSLILVVLVIFGVIKKTVLAKKVGVKQ